MGTYFGSAIAQETIQRAANLQIPLRKWDLLVWLLEVIVRQNKAAF